MQMIERLFKKQKTEEKPVTQYFRTNPDGTVSTERYPDHEYLEYAENTYKGSDEKSARYQEVIDRDNLNRQYSDVLALASGYFKGLGLEHDPLRVVSRETIYEATSRAHGEWARWNLDINGNAGYHGDGRAVIVEDKENFALFGDDYILGIALHEAAHSLKTGETHRIVRDFGYKTTYESIALGSLRKADLRKEAGGHKVGSFWEEAFADLTRVRALRELGRRQDIEETSGYYRIDEESALVGVPNGTTANEQGAIAFPAEFAGAARNIAGRDRMLPTIPGFAAYALELLDTRAPGLYEDFLAARQEPIKQRDAIKKIESIRPGLYGVLRDLEYTEQDFLSGLKLVVEAVSDEG